LKHGVIEDFDITIPRDMWSRVAQEPLYLSCPAPPTHTSLRLGLAGIRTLVHHSNDGLDEFDERLQFRRHALTRRIQQHLELDERRHLAGQDSGSAAMTHHLGGWVLPVVITYVRFTARW